MRSSILWLLIIRVVVGLSAATFMAACGGQGGPTFSVVSESNGFVQNLSVDTKIDVLFVVDNSGSMSPYQANLTANFNAFISSFVTKGFDFHVGVVTTDVYRANYGWGAAYARLKDGVGANHSGIFVIDPMTVNPIQTFLTNASQGTNGSADERSFQSFRTALDSSLNADFRRPNAFLAIVNVSDEDDFSHSNGTDIFENYNYAGLHTIQSYVDYLDTLTSSTPGNRKYSFNSIHVLNAACLAQSNPAANIGVRYGQLVTATGGVQGSLCSPNFSNELDEIQQGILVLASQFYLPRLPIPETIEVLVNGVQIPEDPVNGWTYNPVANSIVFSYAAVPAQGSTIVVNYDPATIL